jgi:hypothetical protein
MEDLDLEYEEGMCKNPYGGYTRLDKVNLQGPSSIAGVVFDVLSNVPGADLMICESFKQAAHEYLGWGFGDNRISKEEFFYASEFFLRVRANDPSTWSGARYMRNTYFDETLGRRVTRNIWLSDKELQDMCADRMWEISNFHKVMDFERFIKMLRAERRARLERNAEQVRNYIELLNYRSLLQNIEPGETIPLKLTREDFITVLTEPTMNDFVELIRYEPRQHTHVLKCRHRRRPRPKAKRSPCPMEIQPQKGNLFACLEANTPESDDSPSRCIPGLFA